MLVFVLSLLKCYLLFPLSFLEKIKSKYFNSAVSFSLKHFGLAWWGIRNGQENSSHDGIFSLPAFVAIILNFLVHSVHCITDLVVIAFKSLTFLYEICSKLWDLVKREYWVPVWCSLCRPGLLNFSVCSQLLFLLQGRTHEHACKVQSIIYLFLLVSLCLLYPGQFALRNWIKITIAFAYCDMEDYHSFCIVWIQKMLLDV